jgi:hypothetical protein
MLSKFRTTQESRDNATLKIVKALEYGEIKVKKKSKAHFKKLKKAIEEADQIRVLASIQDNLDRSRPKRKYFSAAKGE